MIHLSFGRGGGEGGNDLMRVYFVQHVFGLHNRLTPLVYYPQDFKLKNGQFDISLIPDVYDCIKYDVQHNR